jgi:elongation factor Ts
MIGTVGENASLRRAICYKTPDNITLLGYTHPSSDAEIPANTPSFGKYGTIAAFRTAEDSQLEMQKKLCQHIVGMNPLKIGDKEKDEPKANKDDEICLIHQEFLSDPELSVADVLVENNLEIVDYHRFECGETERLKEPENAVNIQTESVNVTSKA